MPYDPHEIATIAVAQGAMPFAKIFNDWESVWVQHRWKEKNAPIFRFTAVERDPIPTLWNRLQFKPKDEVAIYLGRYLATAGIILSRQAAYDATSHGVMLQGVGRTYWASRGSILDKDGNFDGMTFEQVARRVIKPFGVGIRIIGRINPLPYARLRLQPGMALWDFLEHIARPRGILLGADERGYLLLIGSHIADTYGTLKEGHNILKCQCTISIPEEYHPWNVRGQTMGSDNKYGGDAAEQEASIAGVLRIYSPLLTMAEQPVWGLNELYDRAVNEKTFGEGTEVRATITHFGWYSPLGTLWRPGDKVKVESPMAMLNMVMKVECVTWTQDTNGTLTQLDLVIPWLLKDTDAVNVGDPNLPSDPYAETHETAANWVPDPAELDVPEPPPDFLF